MVFESCHEINFYFYIFGLIAIESLKVFSFLQFIRPVLFLVGPIVVKAWSSYTIHSKSLWILQNGPCR